MSRTKYLYKVFGPWPIVTTPLSWPLPPAGSDPESGYIHLSTAKQIPFVLGKFYADVDQVTILKLYADRLETWKNLKWEINGPNNEEFPHLYGSEIEHEDLAMDGVRTVKRVPSSEKPVWEAELTAIGSWLE